MTDHIELKNIEDGECITSMTFSSDCDSYTFINKFVCFMKASTFNNSTIINGLDIVLSEMRESNEI